MGKKTPFFKSVQPSHFIVHLPGGLRRNSSFQGEGVDFPGGVRGNQGYQGMARLIVHLPGRVLRGSSNLEEARAPKHLLL